VVVKRDRRFVFDGCSSTVWVDGRNSEQVLMARSCHGTSGMTCDPIIGLVWIHIERNTMGAIKAIHAAEQRWRLILRTLKYLWTKS
jgi:hypothetical protein